MSSDQEKVRYDRRDGITVDPSVITQILTGLAKNEASLDHVQEGLQELKDAMSASLRGQAERDRVLEDRMRKIEQETSSKDNADKLWERVNATDDRVYVLEGWKKFVVGIGALAMFIGPGGVAAYMELRITDALRTELQDLKLRLSRIETVKEMQDEGSD